MGILKTCCYCGKKYLFDKSNGWGCCEDCYENYEARICRECGKQISNFEFQDGQGLCFRCEEEFEMSICMKCNKEYSTKDWNITLICKPCYEKDYVIECSDCGREFMIDPYNATFDNQVSCPNCLDECDEDGNE